MFGLKGFNLVTMVKQELVKYLRSLLAYCYTYEWYFTSSHYTYEWIIDDIRDELGPGMLI